MEPNTNNPSQNPVPVSAPVTTRTPVSTPVTHTSAPMDSELRHSLLVSGSILLAGLFVAGAIFLNGHTSGGPAAPSAPNAPAATKPADISKVKTDNEPFIGKADAPAIAYWTDYQCPFCKKTETEVMPQIIKDYVDTGKIRIVFKDYPFLGQDSVTAAEYGRAIWKLYPQQYYAWREAMFNAQDAEGDQGFGDAASIDKLNATISGLDAQKITADVAANKAAYDAQANADKAEGAAMGIQGTPGTIIGKQLIPGAYPYTTFQSAIDTVISGK